MSDIDTGDHVHHAPSGEDWVVAYVRGDLHQRARQELQKIERHLTKRCLADEFSLTNLWLLVDANGRGQ